VHSPGADEEHGLEKLAEEAHFKKMQKEQVRRFKGSTGRIPRQ